MSKRLILILALAFMVGLTLTAYAEVQNVKVSGDITVEAIGRNNIKLTPDDRHPVLGTAYNEYDGSISGLLSHIRVKVDADLTDNVSTTVRLLNERVWGEEASSDSGSSRSSSDIDLDLAYVALKEFLYSPLSLTIGRQEISFGNGLIIGDVDTNAISAGHGTGNATLGTIIPKSLDDLSVRKAFDAIRANLNYDPLVLDLVYAKIDEDAIDTNDDADLFGINANYALDKNTTLEGYYWQKRRDKAGPASNLVTTDGTRTYNDRANDDVTQTLGGRVQHTGIKNLLLGLEGAYQFGVKVNNTTLYPNDASNNGAKRDRRAYAIQVNSQYNLSDLVKTYEPSLKATYTFLSGDKYQNTKKKYSAWDPMFENQSGGTLFNKILQYSNLQVANAGASIKPLEDVKLSIDYYYLRLVKATSSSVNNALIGVNLSGIAGDPTYIMKPNKKTLGNEVDALLTYDYTEDVQFGLLIGYFMPTGAFDKRNDNDASQVIGSMKVTF